MYDVPVLVSRVHDRTPQILMGEMDVIIGHTGQHHAELVSQMLVALTCYDDVTRIERILYSLDQRAMWSFLAGCGDSVLHSLVDHFGIPIEKDWFRGSVRQTIAIASFLCRGTSK